MIFPPEFEAIRLRGFKFRGEDQNRFAEADRLEAGGFDPLGGKSLSGYIFRYLNPFPHGRVKKDASSMPAPRGKC